MKNNVLALSIILGLVLLSGCKPEQPADPAATAPADASAAAETAPAAAAAPGTDPASLAEGTMSPYSVPAGLAGAGHCSLDAVNGTPVSQATLAAGSESTFSGWMADGANQVPSPALLVLSSADHAYAAPIKADVDRPDVAAVLASDPVKSFGFNAKVALAGVAPGSYSAMVVYGAAGNQTTCSFNAQLSVN